MAIDLTIVKSVQSMMESFGPGIYGIQIFDASTDMTGKPIVLCQLFKDGRDSNISGEDKDLKDIMPFMISQFQEWLNNKRAIGLSTLASRIEDIIKTGKASIIETTRGGEVQELITIYHNHDIITQDTIELTNMLNGIINLKHRHAKETVEQYHEITRQKRKSMAHRDIEAKGEDFSNSFS